MSEIWRLDSGQNIAVLQERLKVDLPLPLANGSLQKNLKFKIISGSLPTGLYLEDEYIRGVAVEVVRPTVSTFVIRAEEFNSIGQRISIEDRTYNITIEGFDTPEWITPAGPLLLTGTTRLFVLDNTLIDFELTAIDRDLPAGDTLEFFIADGNGTLPPGLTLLPNGRITGTIDPILALDINAQQQFFDVTSYDQQPFDYGIPPADGLDIYPFDTVTFDYNVPVRTPKKLNRNYEFIVTVSDSETLVNRTFRIFVVGDDFLRADNTIMRVGTGVFTADNTYLRAPVWLTPNNLGVRRASNNITIFLDTFDANPDIGPIVYNLEITNSDDSPSELPPGMFLDTGNGELFGFVPYQPAITREYRFTVTATKFDATALGQSEVAIRTAENASLGQTFLKIYPLIAADRLLVEFDTIRIANFSYKIERYEDIDPTTNLPYDGFAILRLSRNLFLDVPAETVITKTYFRSLAQETITRASKEFYISIIGEVDSVIQYITAPRLEPLRSNFNSQLSVKATSSVPRAVVTYKIVNGSLPPGLELKSTGEISGKVLQFGTNETPGLTLFDNKETTFDGNVTTIDREYTVSIFAVDQFKLSGITQDFIIRVLDSDNKLFSNIYARPYQRSDKKALWQNFISDNTIFTPSKIYRPSDPAFGIQEDLKMLVYPGVETIEISRLVSALTKNTAKKRFKIGNLKKAVAKQPGTNNVVYEVLYLEVIDPYENAKGSIKSRIKLPNKITAPVLINQANYESESILKNYRPINDPISIDSDAVNISGRDREYIYPTTVENIRNNIRNMGVDIENEYLPLWMKTSQTSAKAATGFIKAIPICYCNPGDADFIIENIKNSKFNFSELDYEIDRLIIDSTFGFSQEQFLKFGNHQYNI
jgi:hypothetical protein